MRAKARLAQRWRSAPHALLRAIFFQFLRDCLVARHSALDNHRIRRNSNDGAFSIALVYRVREFQFTNIGTIDR